MGLAHKSVKSAGRFGGAFRNYESEGRTFESFRARHSSENPCDFRKFNADKPF